MEPFDFEAATETLVEKVKKIHNFFFPSLGHHFFFRGGGDRTPSYKNYLQCYMYSQICSSLTPQNGSTWLKNLRLSPFEEIQSVKLEIGR